MRRNPTTHAAYRTVIGTVGTLVVVVGVVLIPLPGPGWLIVFAGLAILGTEFHWARRLLNYVRARVAAWTRWLGRQSHGVRVGVSLATGAFVVAAVWLVLALTGLPSWVPDEVATVVTEVSGIR